MGGSFAKSREWKNGRGGKRAGVITGMRAKWVYVSRSVSGKSPES